MRNRQALTFLFIANAISGVAQGISMLAIPWYFARTGDMGSFGLVYVLTNMISFFWVPYAGTLIDRFNRRNIFLILTTISGTLLFIVAGLGFYWGTLPWYLVASIFTVTFLNYNLHFPTLYTFVQEITEPRYFSRITSIIEVMNQTTSVLAGAAAAILLEGTYAGVINIFGFKFSTGWEINSWEIHEIFLLDGFTYLTSFAIILLIRYVPIARRHPEVGNLLQRLQLGYQWLKEHSTVFLFGIASYSIFVSVLLLLFYLAAKYVSDHLLSGGDVYAASEMYFALGSIIAGVAVQRLFSWTDHVMAVILTTVTAATIFLILAITQSNVIFYLMLFLLGFANAGTRIMRTTYLFNHIPNQFYGRCGSIFFLSNIVFRTIFLAFFALPFFQSGNNIIYAFALLAIFLFLSAGVLGKNYRRFLS